VKQSGVWPRLASGCSTGNSASGFTLLEILVVLVVLGILVVGLAQGLHLGMQVWDRQGRALGAVGELDAADRTLRGLIAQMDPGGHVEMSDIDGTDQTLRFTTLLPAASGALPTQRAEVMLLVDQQHRLVLRWTPSPHVVPLVPVVSNETILFTGVDRLAISYKSAAPAAAWQTEWQSPIPPSLVRIRIGFSRSDARRWPDIVAAPMRERG
jgi:general secretion pathway protein J